MPTQNKLNPLVRHCQQQPVVVKSKAVDGNVREKLWKGIRHILRKANERVATKAYTWNPEAQRRSTG